MTDERPTITPCPDGPLLVRGDIDLRRPDGRPIERRRRVIALCRCGLSSIKPFCDGTHKPAGFRTERVDDAAADSTDPATDDTEGRG